ncbi:MAG: redoxin domain-containing protein [Halioglobus sp.]|nr:redoxin domain-containing protein [Halioglobus sp.]
MIIRAFFVACLFLSPAVQASCPDYLNQDMRKLHSSETVNLCEVSAGQPLLIINTASHCGYTKQFKGLEALYKKYGEQGLQVVGFASDDFRQEAKNEEEAAEVCYVNYGVTFTMLAPSSVRGAEANPVFQELARQSESPGWNFNKYLVDSNGKVIEHFSSSTTPEDPALSSAIESVL